jgi:acyl-coenzyme A thioesterase 13
LRVTGATKGTVHFELDIAKDHLVRPFWDFFVAHTYRLVNIPQNRLKILHGGTIASMVDLGGSLAVASKGYYSTGVSTDLNG